MPTDAIIVEREGHIDLAETMTTLVEFKPIPVGRSYVVLGMGHMEVVDAEATIELEAFDAKHTVQLSQVREATFSLVVGTTLPPDDELYTVAKLSASVYVHTPQEPRGASALTAKLVLLPVDSLAVQAVPG
jgi:hypothetical protein